VQIIDLLLADRPAPKRYAIAIAIFGLALLLRLVLLPVEARFAFLTFYPAAVLAFLVAGAGPGRLMVALGALAGHYIFLPPHLSFEVTGSGLLSVLVFVVSAGLIGWVVEQLRSTATRLKTALAELHITEQRYRAIVEEQAELVSLARPDGELVYVNTAYARHFGRTPAQMIGTSLFDWVDPTDRKTVAQQIELVLSSGMSQSGDNRMVVADGTERWVAWTNRVQHDANGQILLHSVGRDITQRKWVDKALRVSQSFLKRTGRIAGVGGWQLDLADNTVTWSAETRRIHEVGPDFMPTLDSAIAFYAPEERPRIAAAVQRSMVSGENWDLELQLVTATGRHIWVRAVGEVERENGLPVRLVGAFQDVTERKLLEQRVADSERFLRQIADSLPLRIAYVDKDRRFQFINVTHSLRFARRREEIIGRTRRELTSDPVDPAVEARYQAALTGQAQHFEFDEPIGGQLRRIEARLVPDIGPDGQVRGFFATGIDITERSAADQALQRQTATLRSVAEAIPASVAVVGSDGRYHFVNSAFERWCGAPREQIIGRSVAEVLGEQECQRRWPWVERALAGESGTFGLAYPGPDGTSYLSISYIPLRLDTGALDGFVAVTQDVTQQKREELRLLDLSQRDPLTGLLNRTGFEQQLEHVVHQGGGASLAVLYIDLDHFKPVNDRHGHPAGDRVLKLFAQRLVNLVRPTDAVARLGGDEFVIALMGVRDGVDAQAVADKVLAAAHAPFHVGALLLQIGASVGVAHRVVPALGWRELVERADRQLLSAKASGRGRLSMQAVHPAS
jgi:diguanylate cyclase (GGDEF)-like protein/PAS domain S-box-containing protein